MIQTTRLYLSEISWEDLEAIHIMNSYPDVARYNTIGIPESIEDSRKLMTPAIEDRDKPERTIYTWVIRKNEDQAFMGELGLQLAAKRFKKAELHYNLLPAYWGMGYASEAVQSILKFGFETLGLHRIEAGVATANLNSIKLLEKMGMVREGGGRKILPLKDGWHDNYYYSILDNDPKTW